MRRLPAAAIAIALALSGPAAAFGQSAGDDQYQDPFAGEEQDTQEDAPQSQAPAESPSTTTAPSAPAAPAPTSSASQTTVPYTGLPAGAVTGLGAVLLGAGLGLRRHSRRT
jgi:hypothetical protein